EAIMQAVPYYRRTVMRAGAIRGLEADLPQGGVGNVLVTHRRVPDVLVRGAVGGIATSGGGAGRLHPVVIRVAALLGTRRSEGAAALEFGGVPLHPGALRAYREAGLLT